MKIVIMAGGKGTRLAESFKDIPKPLVPICGKPILEREIEFMKEQGFTSFIITIGYMGEKIESYFGDGHKFGVDIDYYYEDKPLGNAGALFLILDRLTDGKDTDFILLNGDVLFDVDFERMIRFHQDKGAMITLLTHPNSHPFDSGLIVTTGNNRVCKWMNKEDERPDFYTNRVNAGIQIINIEVLKRLHSKYLGSEKVDFDRQVIKPMISEGMVYAYDSTEYVKDMGTPERYKKVCDDYCKGIVSNKNLRNKQKAIFLDRDGTINKYVGFLRDIDEFELIDGVSDAVRMINDSGYLVIVVTNQPVIARGELSKEDLEVIHQKMETLLGAQGAYLDGLYYCPHHPNKGYEGEVTELKIHCNCRKPNPGMILRAAEDFNLDLSQSWMIGDGKNDVLAGEAAGCKTGYIVNSHDDQVIKADVIGSNLLSIVCEILGESKR